MYIESEYLSINKLGKVLDQNGLSNSSLAHDHCRNSTKDLDEHEAYLSSNRFCQSQMVEVLVQIVSNNCMKPCWGAKLDKDLVSQEVRIFWLPVLVDREVCDVIHWIIPIKELLVELAIVLLESLRN